MAHPAGGVKLRSIALIMSPQKFFAPAEFEEAAIVIADLHAMRVACKRELRAEFRRGVKTLRSMTH